MILENRTAVWGVHNELWEYFQERSVLGRGDVWRVTEVYLDDDVHGYEVFPASWWTLAYREDDRGRTLVPVRVIEFLSPAMAMDIFARYFGGFPPELDDEALTNPYGLEPKGIERYYKNACPAVAIQENTRKVAFWVDWGASQRLARWHYDLVLTTIEQRPFLRDTTRYQDTISLLYELQSNGFMLYERGPEAELPPNLESTWLGNFLLSLQRLNTKEFVSVDLTAPTQVTRAGTNVNVLTEGKIIFNKHLR